MPTPLLCSIAMVGIIIKGLGLGLLLSVSVGPVVFTIIKLSLRNGYGAGFAFAAGVSGSDILLVLLGNMAAELVRTALAFENVIAMVGAGVLLVMGVWSFFYRKDPVMDNSELDASLRRRDIVKYGLQGFLINTMNPGAILFWLSTCTAFAYLPFKERTLLFASCLLVVVVADLLKVLLAGRLRQFFTPHTLHIINRISALILIGFGLVIMASVVF